MGRSLLHQSREKCDDHDDSDKNGHADILTLRIGGRSSVDANIGSNGSHIFFDCCGDVDENLYKFEEVSDSKIIL